MKTSDMVVKEEGAMVAEVDIGDVDMVDAAANATIIDGEGQQSSKN